MYLLIKFESNFADEFDVSGWFVATQDVWEKFKSQELPEYMWHETKNLHRHKTGRYFEIFFGTNESINFSSLEDYFKMFRTKEISDSDAETLIRLFGSELTEHTDENGSYFELRASGTVLNPFDY